MASSRRSQFTAESLAVGDLGAGGDLTDEAGRPRPLKRIRFAWSIGGVVLALYSGGGCPMIDRPLDRVAVSEYLNRVSQARRRPGDEGALAPGDPWERSRL